MKRNYDFFLIIQLLEVGDLKYDLVFSSSKNSYFVFISIFHIHFFESQNNNSWYPIWHLILTYKKNTIFFSLICLQSFFHNFQFDLLRKCHWTHFAENENAKSSFHIMFSFSHFLSIENENETTKKKRRRRRK